MGRITITPKDMKRSKILKPAWYLVEVTDNIMKNAKDGESTNTIIDMEGLQGDAEGIPFRIWINEKAPAIQGVPFFKSLGFPVTEETGLDVDVEDGALKGRRLKVKVVTGEYKGRKQNKIEDFAPAEQAQKAS